MKRLIVLLGILALVLAACGGNGDSGGGDDSSSAGDVAAGEEIFLGTCAACHGTDAHGIEGLGKDLHANAFVIGNSDGEMIAFLQVGRGPDDPANDTGVLMPPRGGNPSLTDEDLQDVVAYLRTLE